MATKKYTPFDIMIYIILAIFGFMFLYPVYYVIILSFSDTYNIARGLVTFFPRGFNLTTYKFILQDVRIPQAYFNTIVYTTLGVLINVALTTVSAYPLSRPDFWGGGVFMKLIVFTMFFGGGLIPSFLLVVDLGMYDTIWSIVLPGAIATYSLIVIRSFFQSLPSSMYESAIIDGASEFRILAFIIIPLSKAAIATITLFYFIGHWNSYFAPLIYLKNANRYPLQIVLRQMLIRDETVNSNKAIPDNLTPDAMKNATIVISMIPVMMVYPFAQRYFMKGVMIGAVKG